MTLFERNLEALGRYHPAVAHRLGALASGPDRGDWTSARSGVPTVRRDGASLVSTFDPQNEASRALAPVPDADFLLLPGLGAGYWAEAVVAATDLPVVVAEADPSWFAEVLRHRDLTPLWKCARVVPLLGPDPGCVGDFLSRYACDRVETLPWRPLVTQEPEWHRALADEVHRAQTRVRVNRATWQRFGSLWKRNLEKNEAWGEARPLESLRGLWAGVPGVIAAAGPSLADTFSWLEAHRSRFVLIAVDTAWPALAARNLFPDVLLVLDGQYANARHVDRAPPESTLVVTEWVGPPRAFRLAPGRTYVATTSLPFLRVRESHRWGTLGALPSGGSVATAAWSLALHLGCWLVAFAGLDLGYPQGQTHVPGSQFEEALHRRSHRLRPAEIGGLGLGPEVATWRPSMDGGLVKSDPRMDLYRDWLAASAAQHPEVLGYNLSTRGTVVPGFLSPPPALGDDWPTVARRSPPADQPLVAQPDRRPPPPFPALRAVLSADDFPGAVTRAWDQAAAYWGPAWASWADRAWATWERFPSIHSRRAIELVVRDALAWEGFWDSSGQS